jgi:hypothetical protein
VQQQQGRRVGRSSLTVEDLEALDVDDMIGNRLPAGHHGYADALVLMQVNPAERTSRTGVFTRFLFLVRGETWVASAAGEASSKRLAKIGSPQHSQETAACQKRLVKRANYQPPP